MDEHCLPIFDFSPQEVHSFESHGVSGWLVVDQLRGGLSFGGMRYSPTVTLADVKKLARTMTWKLAAHGLPVGGAKAGLACGPDHPHIHAILAAAAEAWRKPLSECTVLGKDLGATDGLMDSLYLSLGRPQMHLAQERHAACPNRLRDMSGYVRHMTGRGATWSAQAALGDLRGSRVAIQGAGLVGVGTAIRMDELGAKVVAMSDANGAVFLPEGIPVEVFQAIADGQSRSLDPAAIPSSARWGGRDELFATEADILVLAAASRSVTAELARTIRAPIVIEASNFGLVDDAHAVLHAQGVAVVPDMIASSSSAAMVAHQMATGNRYETEPLWERISAGIHDAVRSSLDRARARNQTIRAAYIDLFTDLVTGGNG